MLALFQFHTVQRAVLAQSAQQSTALCTFGGGSTILWPAQFTARNGALQERPLLVLLAPAGWCASFSSASSCASSRMLAKPLPLRY